MKMKAYQTYIFDCDGVVLNSNHVKTTAFFNTTKAYGGGKAKQFIDYHTSHGGISRYEKFHYFLTKIMGYTEPDKFELEKLLNAYAKEVWNGLLNCEIEPNLEEFRALCGDARWMIASGGDQEELRRLFKLRQIDHFFNCGIYGSPTDKKEIVERAVTTGRVKFPAVFFGDSAYDREAAEHIGADFIFLRQWSETNLEDSCKTFESIAELI